MTFSTWNEVVEVLSKATAASTPIQQTLAEIAGITIEKEIPCVVAAAKLRVALSRELFLDKARPIKEWCEALLADVTGTIAKSVKPQNQDEAFAWLTYHRMAARIVRLSSLKLCAGDIVNLIGEEMAEVSSIAEDGRVYFKGGKGHSAWPDMISSVSVRKDATGTRAETCRRKAESAAAKRKATPEWSAARHADLKEFANERQATHDDIDELEKVIAGATDERPIQEFLDDHMHLLTALLGGNQRYSMSQKRLGSEYVPDFLIADVDSLGIRWILVELETTKSGIYLANASTLDRHVRNGVDQILDWRDWLTSNLGEAHRPRRESGLGLFDIGGHSEGLVLVGNRQDFPVSTKDSKRRSAREKQNIQIHTYDWLIEQLRGAIDHGGPPRFNPFLLHKKDEEIRG